MDGEDGEQGPPGPPGPPAPDMRMPANLLSSGQHAIFTAGATLAVGDIVYIDSADGAQKADANAAGKYPAVGLVVEAAVANAPVRCLVHGYFRDSTAYASFAPGAVAYLSTTAGGVTATQPSATDDVIQVLGVFRNFVLYFNPSMDYATHV